MDIQELKSPIEELCKAMRIACEKAGLDIDSDTPTRAEIVFFVMYLINDDGGFNEDELKLIEEAAGYAITREFWSEIMELGRLTSDEEYLSQPPASIMTMVEMDNALYEMGEDLACLSAIMEVYKFVGDVFVRIKGFTDEKRQKRLRDFIDMVYQYEAENTKDPKVTRNVAKKKGVPAPKKK